MVPFGGWEMPLDYGSTVAEHLACRDDAVVFDVSHLGTVRISSPDAYDRIQAAFTNDLDKIGPGRAQYTHLLDQHGSVVDDIIVWWHPDGATFDVMPNASNTDAVRSAIGGADITDSRVVLAVQGRHAITRLSSVFPAAAEVGRFRVALVEWNGAECVVAGTGYTGEPGVEIAIPADHADSLWDALIEAGITPAGLGARDTLRLEAGLPLHGNELGPGITPLQANLGWVVAFDKDTFIGKDALISERDAGIWRVLTGIATEGRRPPRAGAEIVIDGNQVGTVTSGNLSPVLGHGVALGYIETDVPAGAAVEVVVRGHSLSGTIVPIPFIKP